MYVITSSKDGILLPLPRHSTTFHLQLSRLGSLCARYPLLTLAAVASLSLGLSYGVAFLRVTDNPLELWSSKQSQSRIERGFYEGVFDPFYRVAHVIVTPTKQEVNTLNMGL